MKRLTNLCREFCRTTMVGGNSTVLLWLSRSSSCRWSCRLFRCRKICRAATPVWTFAMSLRLMGISPWCRNLGEFHVFATAAWNVALLLRLARTCGTLQHSIYDKLWKRCREGQGDVLDKMRKEVVETNVEHCKERSGEIIQSYLRFYAVGFRHVLSCSMVRLKFKLLGILHWCKCYKFWFRAVATIGVRFAII